MTMDVDESHIFGHGGFARRELPASLTPRENPRRTQSGVCGYGVVDTCMAGDVHPGKRGVAD